jgi:hypothetical protein
MRINNTVQSITGISFAFVTKSSGSYRCSASFAVKHECGIFGNFEPVIPEPLTYLSGIYTASFGYFGYADALVISDIVLNFLEFSFGLFPAVGADRRSCNIIEELSAVLAISYIH